MRLTDALRGISKLFFDTSPSIYFVEANPTYDALVTEVFRRVASGTPEGFTSALTLTEVLVRPLAQGNAALATQYRNLICSSTDLQTLPINLDIAEKAADLRARYSLRTPDALQVATALHAGCDAILTNDAGMARVTELRVLMVDDLQL